MQADMLSKWLRGMGYTEGLAAYIQQFPEAKYHGKIYRGLYFDHYPSISEINSQNFCSWTTDLDTAKYFASHGKYGFVLIKESTGYEVEKILSILKDRNELPERLMNYRNGCSEKEVLDGFDVKSVKIQRTGC